VGTSGARWSRTGRCPWERSLRFAPSPSSRALLTTSIVRASCTGTSSPRNVLIVRRGHPRRWPTSASPSLGSSAVGLVEPHRAVDGDNRLRPHRSSKYRAEGGRGGAGPVLVWRPITYELLTGHKPLGVFEPPSRLETAGLAHRSTRVVMAGLERRPPDDRYPTIQEFGDALDRALTGGARVVPVVSGGWRSGGAFPGRRDGKSRSSPGSASGFRRPREAEHPPQARPIPPAPDPVARPGGTRGQLGGK